MLILLLSSAMAGTLPPGEVLDNAVAVHVSQGGLDTLGNAVAGLVPTTFEEASIAGEFECDAGDDSPLGYAINGFVADIEVTNVGLVASDGRLDLDLDIALTATADEVAITGDCTFLFRDLDQSCGLEISAADPITLGLHLGIEMELLDDGSVDVTTASGARMNPAWATDE